RVRAARRSAQPLHPRDDPAARAPGQKLAAIRRRRRRGKAARAAIQDFRRRPDRAAAGVEAWPTRPVSLRTPRDRLLRPLPRLRGRDREGARDKIHPCKLTPPPPPPPQRGGGRNEGEAKKSNRFPRAPGPSCARTPPAPMHP